MMKNWISYQNYIMKKSWLEQKDAVNCAPDPVMFIMEFFTDRSYLKQQIRSFLADYGEWKSDSLTKTGDKE